MRERRGWERGRLGGRDRHNERGREREGRRVIRKTSERARGREATRDRGKGRQRVRKSVWLCVREKERQQNERERRGGVSE